MRFRVARHPVDDAVRLVGEPRAVDDVVGGFGGREEGEVRDGRFRVKPGMTSVAAFGSAQNDKTSSAGDVAEEEGVVGEAGGGPLGEVAVGAHDALGGLEDGPQGGEVSRCGRTDYHLS